MPRPSAAASLVAPIAALAAAASLAALPAPARAIDPDKSIDECTLQAWRVRDGLPGSWVRSILQSEDGYLWIGTYGGVARYDGERLEPLGAPGPFFRLFDALTVKRTPDGRLQIVPSTGVPACLDEGGLRDCALEGGPGLPPGTRLVDVHQDADGTAWLAARTVLYRHRPPPAPGGRGTLDRVPFAAPPDGEARATFVHRDRAGRLWLGTLAGLYGGTPAPVGSPAAADPPPSLTPYQGPPGSDARSVSGYFESPAGHLWFAFQRGLLRVAGGQSHFIGAAEGWAFARPSQVLEDRDGNLWVGTIDGLVRLREGRFTRFGREDGLPDPEVTALYEDREGSLWVGTRSGGLVQFTDRTVATDGGPPLLRDQRWVESVTEDEQGALWFGWRQGLVRFHQGRERLYRTGDGLPSDNVLALASDPGELWIGTERGLARLTAATGGPGDRIQPVRPAGAPITGRVEVLLREPDGSLLLAHDGRLGRLAGGVHEELALAPGLVLGAVRGLARDRQGQLIVAGVSGVARLAPPGPDGGERLVDAGLPRELRTARAVHRDERGRLWIATGAGLLRVGEGPPFIYGAREGIADRQLFQILSDGRGALWVGSSRGILRLPMADLDRVAAGHQARVYALSLDVSDRRRDVMATNVRQPGALRDRQGRLWFATEQGPLLIDPRRLRVNDRPPNVRIENATVDGRPLRHGLANDLPPGPGNLEFRFSTVTLLEPHKTLHRYRLEGFDAGWVEAGARRAAYYTNIPAGRYRFLVQGSNADGIWSQTGDAVAFRLRPHFYRSAWFYGVSAALLLGLVALLWRLRVRSLRREYLAAFAERSRVARELHDTLLQGMSAVGLQLRGLRRRLAGEAPGAARELELLEGTITSSLQETRRFLGDLRDQPGPAADLGVALERLAGRLGEGQPARVTVSVEGTAVALPHDVTGDLFRIAQEAVSNALRHAGARTVGVRLSYLPEAVALTVQDDGRGFDPAQEASRPGHFGLVGMKERAARLGGLALDSRPGAGTSVKVEVRLPVAR